VAEDPGVMGNLPRSRPGRRSAKRATGGTGKKGASKAGGAKSRSAGAGARQTRARSSAAKPQSERARTSAPSTPPPPRPQPGDPLSEAIRLATRLAGAGLGVAAGVLRRLPRG